MSPLLIKILMSVAATAAVAGAQFISDPTLKAFVTGLGGTLAGWAHGPRPGDVKADK